MADISNIDQDIRTMLAEILETEPDTINPQANFSKDLGMDSMMSLEILAAIEKKYRIVVPEDMMAKFVSLEQTANVVKDILNKKK